MKIVIAYGECDGLRGVDEDCAHALADRVRGAGHPVEIVVVPFSSLKSPQQQALACQLMPTDAYADALWALNFPACLLRHRRRRVWFTHARPFGIDSRAPVGSLRPLLLGFAGDLEVRVASASIAHTLGIADEAVVGLPPVMGCEIAGEAGSVYRDASQLQPALGRAHDDLAAWFEARA
jgi:hypothetical protein